MKEENAEVIKKMEAGFEAAKKDMATKTDISTLATKKDISTLATKGDIAGIKDVMVTKENAKMSDDKINGKIDRLEKSIEALVEVGARLAVIGEWIKRVLCGQGRWRWWRAMLVLAALLVLCYYGYYFVVALVAFAFLYFK